MIQMLYDKIFIKLNAKYVSTLRSNKIAENQKGWMNNMEGGGNFSPSNY